MPACGQAVGCGVCDTPELWCGAAGLCARVRACAGAAESLHTYIHKKSSGGSVVVIITYTVTELYHRLASSSRSRSSGSEVVVLAVVLL